MAKAKGKVKPAKPVPTPEPKKRGRGRQPEITPEKVTLIVTAIANGTPRMQAAALARISYTSYRNWVAWGEEAWQKAGECQEKVKDADRLYVRLFLEVAEVKAKLVSEALTNIRKAGKKHWQANAWVLSRLCPAQFADNRQELAAIKKQFADFMREIAQLKAARPEATVPDPNPVPVPVPSPDGLVPDPTKLEPITPSIAPPLGLSTSGEG